jgi:hypothetical protein
MLKNQMAKEAEVTALVAMKQLFWRSPKENLNTVQIH